MANYFYGRTMLTGGSLTSLDAIDGSTVFEGDGALVMVAGAGVYFYILDEDSGATETAPTIIAPDANAGNKRWILQNVMVPGLTSPVSGDLVYRGASSWERLVKGSAKQVLTMDNGGNYPVWAAAAGMVGSLMMWPLDTPPTGYFECDGTAYSSTAYPDLFAVIGYRYGGSSGTFNVPDARGLFPRFWAHGKTSIPERTDRTDRGDGTVGDNIGTLQGYQTANYSPGALNQTLDPTALKLYSTGSGTVYYLEPRPGTALETRPMNINLMLCIKY